MSNFSSSHYQPTARGRIRLLALVPAVALALATAALATLALAAPAQADTTVGQTGGDEDQGCSGATVHANTNYVVPSGGGTITSFSFESVAGNAGQQLDFLVLRPAGGSDWTVVGKTGLVTLAGTGAVETFAANIDVEGGDRLGFWVPETADVINCFRLVDTGGGAIFSFEDNPTDPSVGDPVSLPLSNPSRDFNESANLVPTPTPTPTIADLVDSVEEINPPIKLAKSLLQKLNGAQKNLDAGDTVGACDKLASFIAAVSAQSGKKNGIATDDAEGLIDQAEAVRESLGCG